MSVILNIPCLVTETCPGCRQRVSEVLVTRAAGNFMESSVYCETCDELVPMTEEGRRTAVPVGYPTPQGDRRER